MNWELLLQVTAPLILMMGWGYGRLREEIRDISSKVDKLDDKVDRIDQRLSRLEGRFEERGYWESRKNGTEKQ